MTDNEVTIRLSEKTLVDLLAYAIAARISRDYDTLDDLRTAREMLADLVRTNQSGNRDLTKYLAEMLNGETHEISDSHLVTIPDQNKGLTDRHAATYALLIDAMDVVRGQDAQLYTRIKNHIDRKTT